ISTDSGSSWAAAGDFPISSSNGAIKITAMDNGTDTTLYALIVDTSTSGGFHDVERSDDDGTTWTSLGTPRVDCVPTAYAGTIAVDPSSSDTVYIGGTQNGFDMTTGGFIDQIIESTDGGSTWDDISQDASGNGVHPDHHALAFDANGVLLDGNDGGMWRLD